MTDTGICSICDGTGKNMFSEACVYCNGTGEWNQAADEYLRNHICQCVTWDRLHCPVCKLKCHHDSSSTPKQKIDPGYGGMTSTISIAQTTEFTNTISSGEEMQEELIVA